MGDDHLGARARFAVAWQKQPNDEKDYAMGDEYLEARPRLAVARQKLPNDENGIEHAIGDDVGFGWRYSASSTRAGVMD